MKDETLLAIDGEQRYQTKKWTNRVHPVSAWLLIINKLAAQANVNWVDNNGDDAALDTIRKIAATCATAMDQHKAIPRQS